jgi:Glycosyltransferases involved in cell wall biogenesis
VTKFSIITINRNNAVGLQKTIESVVTQTYRDFEYIIIDGASTDNSVDIIKQYADKITHWISEPDNGVYNAMNKGIARSQGEHLLFLNSGDFFVDKNVLNDCALKINENIEICSGNLWVLSEDKVETKLKPLTELTLYSCMYYGPFHPCTFIKRTLFDKYGLYNEESKLSSDWEFFLISCGLNEVVYLPLDRDIACFNTEGISEDPGNAQLLRTEGENALKKHLLPSIRKDIERLIFLENQNKEEAFVALRKIKSRRVLYQLVSRVLCVVDRIFVRSK